MTCSVLFKLLGDVLVLIALDNQAYDAKFLGGEPVASALLPTMSLSNSTVPALVRCWV